MTLLLNMSNSVPLDILRVQSVPFDCIPLIAAFGHCNDTGQTQKHERLNTLCDDLFG